MIVDTKKFIEFLGDHNMKPNQFMLCWILYLDKEEYRGESLPSEGLSMANIYRYKEMVGPWPDEDIHDLVEREYLRDFSSGKNYYPDQLEVTEKFSEAVFATISDFEKFTAAYPDFTDHFDDPRKGQIPLKAVDMDKVEKIFHRNVQTKAEFDRLMKALEWAKDNNMVRMNILNYVSGKIWRAHLKKMKEDKPQVKETTIN